MPEAELPAKIAESAELSLNARKVFAKAGFITFRQAARCTLYRFIRRCRPHGLTARHVLHFEQALWKRKLAFVKDDALSPNGIGSHYVRWLWAAGVYRWSQVEQLTEVDLYRVFDQSSYYVKKFVIDWMQPLGRGPRTPSLRRQRGSLYQFNFSPEAFWYLANRGIYTRRTLKARLYESDLYVVVTKTGGRKDREKKFPVYQEIKYCLWQHGIALKHRPKRKRAAKVQPKDPPS